MFFFQNPKTWLAFFCLVACVFSNNGFNLSIIFYLPEQKLDTLLNVLTFRSVSSFCIWQSTRKVVELIKLDITPPRQNPSWDNPIWTCWMVTSYYIFMACFMFHRGSAPFLLLIFCDILYHVYSNLSDILSLITSTTVVLSLCVSDTGPALNQSTRLRHCIATTINVDFREKKNNQNII